MTSFQVIADREVSGKEFNEMMKGKTFYKFTVSDEMQYDLKIHTGLNIDPKEWKPKLCRSGGLHFTDLEHCFMWILHDGFCRLVIVPDDARVSIGQNKFKADKIILSERVVPQSLPELRKILLNDRHNIAGAFMHSYDPPAWMRNF